MAKVSKNVKKKNNKKNNNKYNAENEIIIGVTTKPKEVTREKKKNTRVTSDKNNKKKSTTRNSRLKQNKKNNIHKANNLGNKRGDIKTEVKIKKINRKRRTISIVILLIIILAGTIYYLTTPAFNISNIIINGNEKNDDETYISLSKIVINETNMFAFTNGSIRDRLKENSYVDSVMIKRKFPNTVEIYVTERKVAYQINYSNTYIYLDNQGYILEINEEKKNVPTIQGMNFVDEKFKVGNRISNDDLMKLDKILKIFNYCKYNNIESKITNIDVGNTSNYTLYFEEDNKIAYLGDVSNLSERILWLKKILQKEKDYKGEIFINGDLKEEKVYFRENK